MGRAAWDSTTVAALGDGRYGADIDPVWELAMVPQGGVIAAVAARAMAAELATDQPLRCLHVAFVSPVPSGPVRASVEVLRRGRSVSQASARVTAPGAAQGLTALGIFGGDRPGFAFTELVPPDLPDPEACFSFREPPPPEADVPDWDGPWPFWVDILDGRTPLGSRFWEREPGGPAEATAWYRFEDEPLGPDGLIDPLALLVMADMMPGAVFARVGRTEERWFSPSVDLSVHLFGHATPGWLLAHAKAHHAGDGYASAESALWDPRGPGGPTLVAWASQQMFFTKIS